MRALVLSASLVLGGVAHAQPIAENPPTKTIQCLEVNGRSIPPVCRVPGSRLDPREDLCTCPDGGQRIEVAVCAKGQRQAPEGRALNLVRREAMRDGSLLGDMFAGQPICVTPRNR